MFALKEACALILSDVWTTDSDPVETFCPRSPEARLCRPEGETWFGKIVLFPESQPETSFVTGPHPGQNMRQRVLYEYLRKLLLTPDEFMQLLEDC